MRPNLYNMLQMNRSLHNVHKDDSDQKLDFDFKKSLKPTPRFPILEYFRVERYLTRPLASLVVRLIWRTRITPNQVTVLSFLTGIVAASIFLRGTRQAFLVAGLVTWLASILDCADGMLARARNQQTRYGAYLDLFFDRITDFFLFTCAVIGHYIYSGNLLLLLLGGVSIALYFLQVTLYYLVREYQQELNQGASAEPRGLTLFVFSLCAVFARQDIFVFVGTVEVVLNVLYRFVKFMRLRHQ